MCFESKIKSAKCACITTLSAKDDISSGELVTTSKLPTYPL